MSDPARSKAALRELVRVGLHDAVDAMNLMLSGEFARFKATEVVLQRVGRGGKLPHWFGELKEHGVLPNLDGKTIGSVLEMLFVAVLETQTLSGERVQLRINPASGVDLPDLDLGIKSPSENFCTSEPFFAAYDRILGAEHDMVALLTDYQVAKRNPPLRLQITNARYLRASELADENLCALASRYRGLLLEDRERSTKVLRFLAHVNQSDWQARQLIRVFRAATDAEALEVLRAAPSDFKKQNSSRAKKGRDPIEDSDLDALEEVRESKHRLHSLVEAADNWVLRNYRDFARLPSENEWRRFQSSPLDGKIGMSFALQWRFNFGRVFGAAIDEEAAED